MVKNRVVFTVTLGELAEVPGMPFAYWAPESLRELFRKYPPLDCDVARMPDKPKIADVKQGLATADDLRFTRFFWEVPVEAIGASREETFQGKKWVPFAKGGRPFYHDIQLVVNWERDGEEIKAYCDASGRQLSRPQNESFYFREGLAWTKSAWIRDDPRIDAGLLPTGAIFTAKRMAIFAGQSEKELFSLCAFLRSLLATVFVNLMNPSGRNREAGHLAQLPISPGFLSNEPLLDLAREAYDRLQEWATGDETATVFVAPWILQVFEAVRSGTLHMPATGHPLARDFAWRYGIPEAALERGRSAIQNKFSLYALAEACVIWETELRKRIDEIHGQIDDEVFRLYGISEEDRAVIEAEMGKPAEVEEPESEGMEAGMEEDTQSGGVLTVEEHLRRLVHYLAHQVVREDPDGIVPLRDCYLAGRSEPEPGLVSRTRRKLQEIFGDEAMPAVERELQRALGKSLDDWLAADFFRYHVGLYRLRPIVWQIVPPGGQGNQSLRRKAATRAARCPYFSVFLSWHRLDADTLRKIRHVYLQPFLDAAEREVQKLEQKVTELRGSGVPFGRLAEEEQEFQQVRFEFGRLKDLAERIETLLRPHALRVESRSEWVKEKVNEIVSGGYCPNRDYGVRVNIEPLKQMGILPEDAARVRG
uniref:BREX-1 system adenine-specific DNA-methyltransferase PglX n=1 Tax=Candidatus Caldatribacterium saccharofermentans TaxID=1454753 RepID=A0A7V4TES9_9BACT